MTKEVTISEKKDFLRWFQDNAQLKHRGASWILNYLLNHEIVLNKVHFVENADKSPRGVIMSAKNIDYPDFQFHKEGRVYNNPEQAFHDIRLNWHHDLYLEIKFNNAWRVSEYLTVLEDNPYHTWNDTVPQELEDLANEAMDHFLYEFYREQFEKKIEEALDKGDKKAFIDYSKKLKQMAQES